MRFPILGNHATSPSNSADSFMSIECGAAGGAWNANNSVVRFYTQMAFNISDLVLECVTAPGVGKSWTLAIEINGTASTKQVAVLANTNTKAFATTNTPIRVNVGDYVCMKMTPAGTPAAPTSIRWGFMVDTLGVPKYFWSNAYGAPSTAATNYKGLNLSSTTWATGVAERGVTMSAHDCTINELHYTITAAPGVGSDWTFTLLKDGVAQDGSAGTPNTVVTISGAVAVTGSVTGLSLSVTAGTQLTIRAVPNVVPPAAMHMSCTTIVTPKYVGEYSSGSVASALNTGVVQWIRARSNYTSVNTTADTNPKEILPTNWMFYFRKFIGTVATAPGAAKTWTVITRKNGSATGITNTFDITGAATVTGSDMTHVDAIFGNNNISTQITPSGTPAASASFQYANVSYIPPAIIL